LIDLFKICIYNHFKICNHMRRFTLALRVAVFVLLATTAQAQIKLGDNPGTINANSLLELESNAKGLLFSRMTNAEMTGITAPPAGLVIFNTTNNCLYVRRTADWFSLCNADPGDVTNGFQITNVTNVQMLAITNTTTGQIVYNTDNNCIYVRTPTGWVSMCDIYTGSNGITVSPTKDIQLGGSLTGNTTIAAGTGGTAYSLTMSGDNPLTLPGLQTGATNNIVTLGAGGVLQTRTAGDLLNTTAWRLDGNSATTAGTNFLGTTDDEEFVLKTNNTERLRVLTTTVAGNDVAGALAVGRTTANATFHLGGSMALPVTSQAADYTVTATDHTVLADPPVTGMTLTLPDPTTCSGRTYLLVKSDLDATHVLSFSRPIHVNTTQSMNSVNYNVRLHIQSDGTQWWLIARF
jgi:hypothetical protein